MRTFQLQRDVDHTGLSGTGIVAEGVTFDDGTTVVRWREVEGVHYDRGVRATTVVFPNPAAVEALHGHGGATRIVWGPHPAAPIECLCGGEQDHPYSQRCG